jgi:1,4-alpha-glucan branching enzyme
MLHVRHSADTALTQDERHAVGTTGPERGKPLIKTTKPDRNDVVRVTFVLPAGQPPGAVSVVGDFNDWNPLAHPLRRRGNGTRSTVVSVPSNRTLRFRYLAEGGVWFDDETAPGRDSLGTFIAV